MKVTIIIGEAISIRIKDIIIITKEILVATLITLIVGTLTIKMGIMCLNITRVITDMTSMDGVRVIMPTEKMVITTAFRKHVLPVQQYCAVAAFWTSYSDDKIDGNYILITKLMEIVF
jgi:hypothetical protein